MDFRLCVMSPGTNEKPPVGAGPTGGLAVVIICGSRGTWIDDGRVDEPDVDQKSS